VPLGSIRGEDFERIGNYGFDFWQFGKLSTDEVIFNRVFRRLIYDKSFTDS